MRACAFTPNNRYKYKCSPSDADPNYLFSHRIVSLHLNLNWDMLYANRKSLIRFVCRSCVFVQRAQNSVSADRHLRRKEKQKKRKKNAEEKEATRNHGVSVK